MLRIVLKTILNILRIVLWMPGQWISTVRHGIGLPSTLFMELSIALSSQTDHTMCVWIHYYTIHHHFFVLLSAKVLEKHVWFSCAKVQEHVNFVLVQRQSTRTACQRPADVCLVMADLWHCHWLALGIASWPLLDGWHFAWLWLAFGLALAGHCSWLVASHLPLADSWYDRCGPCHARGWPLARPLA